MITWFMHGGVIMGPLLFLLLIIIGLSIWKAIELFFFGRELSRYRLELCLNAIIFWGGNCGNTRLFRSLLGNDKGI